MSFFNFNPLELRPRRAHESQENIVEEKSATPNVNKTRPQACSFLNRRNIWRLTSGFMGFFFLLAAAVQLNDPDPYLWLPAYMIPCIISWAVSLAYAKLVDLDEQTRKNKLGNINPKSSQPLTFQSIISLLLGNLDTIILLDILYSFALGIWTLTTCTLLAEENMFNWRNHQELLEMSVLRIKMNDEEAKELLGLCLIIAWLALLKNRNFIYLGKIGIWLGIVLTLTPFLSWIIVAIMEDSMMSSCSG